MANIFIAFFNGVKDPQNPNAVPIFYQSFVEGLQKAGNNVYTIAHPYFAHDFGYLEEEELKQNIRNLKLDICFIFNNSFYDLSDVVDCPIIIYEVDSPVYFSNKELLRKNPNRYIYFIAQTDSEEIIKKEFGASQEQIFYVPYFSEIRAEDVEKVTNIAFIGSKFNPSASYLPCTFWKELSIEEKVQYKKCLEAIMCNPQVSSEELFCRFSIRSEMLRTKLNTKEILMYLSGEKRIQLLSSLVDLGLDLYGTESWADAYYYDSRLNMAFNEKRVYSKEHNQEIYNSAKIGINVSHLQAISGFPWRVMDIMASSACLVTDYHSDFERLFPRVEIPTYNSISEARELCYKLINDDIWRRDILIQCQEVINNKYRFRHLLAVMEEYSGVKMHDE